MLAGVGAVVDGWFAAADGAGADVGVEEFYEALPLFAAGELEERRLMRAVARVGFFEDLIDFLTEKVAFIAGRGMHGGLSCRDASVVKLVCCKSCGRYSACGVPACGGYEQGGS